MPQIFIHWVENHLCSFHFEITINSSAMNIYFPVFEWKYMQIYLEYLSRRGIFVSYGRNMFYLLHVCSVAQLYLTLCEPHGLYSPSSSSVHGIFRARVLDWVACSPPGASRNQTPDSFIGRYIFLSTVSPWKPFLLLESSKFFCKMILLMYTPTSSLQKTHCSTVYPELICHFHTGGYEIVSCCSFI